MTISWNWLKQWLPATIPVNQAAEILTDIGLEVESVTPYESVKGSLNGLLVAHVVSVEKHPDADRLKITQVDFGGESPVQVVCGAPNVAAGQKVIFAPVGTTLYPVNGESIIIRKAKIRGVESEGMLCAEDEIGLGKSHDGLYILHESATIGSAVAQYFNLYSDTIFEIGLTANHADAFSHYGVARELRAALQVRNIETLQLTHTLFENYLPGKAESKYSVEVLDNEKCIRYSGVYIENVQVKESPAWLQNMLRSIGLRSINNIVDITNYILHGLGQPMHAFDAKAIAGNKIIVQTLPAGTAFITLDEKERKLSEHDLMICNAESPMCIAGVLGGLHSGITDSTTGIFLESACFHQKSISQTERYHSIKTDASSRFNKGTDPEMTMHALQIASRLVVELAGGHIASPYFDIYPNPVKQAQIRLRYKRFADFTAITISAAEIQNILQAIHIQIVQSDAESVTVEIPAYKNDVTREIDVIEEILRLYGYNKVAIPTTIRAPFTLRPKPDNEYVRLSTGKKFTAKGFYEIFTNSISRSKYIQKFAPGMEKSLVSLKNSLNNELDCLRQTHIFSGLEVIQYNVNRRQTNLKCYEFGKTFFKTAPGFDEKEILVLYITGNSNAENWKAKQYAADIFDIKQHIHLLLNDLGIHFSEKEISNNPFLETGNVITSAKQQIGNYGVVHEKITAEFDIRQPVYFAELDWKGLLLNMRKTAPDFSEIPKFPEVRRDLALILDPSTSFEAVKEVAVKEGKNVLRDVILFDVYEGKNLEGKKSYAIGLTFRDDNQTLTDTVVDNIMQAMILRYESELKAIIRK